MSDILDLWPLLFVPGMFLLILGKPLFQIITDLFSNKED